MSAKISAKGLYLQLSIAGVFTTIAAVDSLMHPKSKVETADVTDLSTGVGRRKSATGYVDGGQCTGTLFFDPVETTHKALTAKITTPPSAADSWKIVHPDAATTEWPFSGFLTEFSPSGKVGDFLKADFSIDLDGIVTYPV